jgi:hypothetical protein
VALDGGNGFVRVLSDAVGGESGPSGKVASGDCLDPSWRDQAAAGCVLKLDELDLSGILVGIVCFWCMGLLGVVG